MSDAERITKLEERIAYLENRVATLEARGMTYGPINPPSMPPVTNPWVPNPWPGYPNPYTITCKMEDGTTKEIKIDSPIVAQGTGNV